MSYLSIYIKESYLSLRGAPPHHPRKKVEDSRMSSASPIEIQFYWQEAFSGTTVLSSSSICQLANNGNTTYPVRRIVA
ncbi:unnamed protein product [Brassica oleracea]